MKYDSHLAPRERIALLERMQTGNCPDGDPEPVWNLLADPGALQAEMIAVIEGAAM